MNDKLQFGNYKINMELDEELGALYIKMNDITSNICYENKLNKGNLTAYVISYDISYLVYQFIYDFSGINIVIYFSEIYDIIKKSFNQTYGYTVVITKTNGIITLGFVNIRDSHTSIKFDICLREQKNTTTNHIYAFDMNNIYAQMDRIEKNLDILVGSDKDLENPICLFNWFPYFNDSTYKEKIKLD